jgi:transposase
LIKGGNFPLATVYPKELRAVRDLLRRRMYLVRVRGEYQAHIQLTHYQYNLPAFEKKLERKNNRTDAAERFSDADVRKNVEVDLGVMDYYGEQVKQLEFYIIRHAKQFDPRAYLRLQSVPGIDAILALVMMYEIQDINRFTTVQSFCSYGRLAKCPNESAGKRLGFGGGKVGNAHLK